MAWWLVLVVIVTWVPAGWLAGRFGQAWLGHGGLEWDWSRPLDTPEGRTWLRLAKLCGWLSWIGVVIFLGLLVLGQQLLPDADPETAVFSRHEIDDYLKVTDPY